MNRKGLLFSLISLVCVATTAGCGESGGEDAANFNVVVESSDAEYGSISGGGNYKIGETVNLKVHPNIGCDGDSPTLSFYAKANAEGVPPENITSLQYDEAGKFYQYTLQVSDDTIGKYVANFTCKTNDPNGENAAKAKYKVNFNLVKENGTVQKDIIEAKEVTSGEKITQISYLEAIDGRLEWYVNYDSNTKEFSEQFDFSKSINDNLTLYAKITDTTPIEVVKTALNTFKYQSNKIQITYVETGEVASIVDGPLVKGAGAFNAKANIKVATSDGTKFIIKDNIYHIYSKGYYKAFKLDGSNFANAKAVPEAYKFFDMIDFDINDTVYNVEKNGVIDSFEIDADNIVTCEIYSIVDRETENIVAKLYIHNGNLYKVEREDKSDIIIKYPENLAGTNIPSDKVKDAYSIKLFSNENGLNQFLSQVNESFDKLLKITPGLDTDLETLLLEEANKYLHDELKRYEYDFYTYISGSCTNAKFSNSAINKNTNLCVKVNMIDEDTPVKFDYIQAAINNLSIGGYSFTTSISAFGGEETLDKIYDVKGTEDILESENKPDGMVSVMWNTFKALKTLKNDYYRFSYNPMMKEYSFYNSKVQNHPYLKITLTENLELQKIVFFDDPVNGGDGNTYTSMIEYKDDRYTQAAIKVLFDGGYKVDVEGSGRTSPISIHEDKGFEWILGMYREIAESPISTEENKKIYEDLSNLYEIINNIRIRKEGFEYDDEEKTYSNSDGTIYKLTFDGNGKIVKITHTSPEEVSIVYTFDHSL